MNYCLLLTSFSSLFSEGGVDYTETTPETPADSGELQVEYHRGSQMMTRCSYLIVKPLRAQFGIATTRAEKRHSVVPPEPRPKVDWTSRLAVPMCCIQRQPPY